MHGCSQFVHGDILAQHCPLFILTSSTNSFDYLSLCFFMFISIFKHELLSPPYALGIAALGPTQLTSLQGLAG